MRAIVAVGNQNQIGCDGKLLWYEPEDLKHFKKLTSGGIVVMGRKTFESIGMPLPNRINIVLTNDRTYTQDGVNVVNDWRSVLEAKDAWIIGGESIYRLFWDYLTEIHITHVDCNLKGDTYFPIIGGEWRLKKERRRGNLIYRKYVKP